LVPRQPRDYLPRLALILPAVSVTAGIAGGAAYLLVPKASRVPFDTSGQLRGSLVLCGVAALITVIGARLIVTRPQPAPSPDLVAVDDALRAHALHVLAATGNAISLLGVSGVYFQVVQASRNTFADIACLVAALVALSFAASSWF